MVVLQTMKLTLSPCCPVIALTSWTLNVIRRSCAF